MPSLYQKILVLAMGPTNDEGIVRGVAKSNGPIFKSHVEKATKGQVKLELFYPEYLNNDFHTDDFMDFGGTLRYIAKYNKTFDDILVHNCGIKPYQYDYILRVYKHPPKLVSGFYANTWMWYNQYLGTPHLKKGYTSLLANPTPPPGVIPPPMWETMVHEYCHQLEHRFNDAGVKYFVNSDRKNELQSNPFFTSTSNIDFYYKIMANLEFPYNGIQSVPYHKLNGIAGVWK